LISGELPDGYNFPDDVAPTAGAGVLGPRGAELLGPAIPKEGTISDKQISEMQDGRLNLYIFGWVRYFDGFKNTPERITKFCYRVKCTGDPKVPFVYEPHKKHNCADEDCEKE
jgi:hypothetical protein